MGNKLLMAGFPAGSEKWRVLSGGAIKIIGITLMVMDHLYQMFVSLGAPIWLKWLGRPVAAMFLFLCAEGFSHTRNKRLYMLRFLGASVFMGLGNQLLGRLFPVEDVALINNIFGTLFLCVLYMLMADFLLEGIRGKKPGRILLALGGMLLPLILGFVMVSILFRTDSPSLVAAALFFAIPTPLSAEGGVVLIAVGVLFYIVRNWRWAQALVPVATGLLVALASGYAKGVPDAQWLMVFAALPILLYNGRRGWGAKYFFYAFYPLHIYLLYFIAWIL